ncbi:MAG: methionine--tRNA ligase [Planctomycetota bacterium]|nr:methionine--tRNA ligase [Planctomycetota bacterium]
MAGSPLYITTPIYYVNDKPHIGHVYTTILCDVWARFFRFQGEDVFFLTGTDEHGMKIEKAAAARGIEPQQLVDENAAEFKRVMALFDFTNNDFIRTTEDRHLRQVQVLVRRLEATGDVYLGEFEGWYDEGQEEYIPENKAKDLEYKSPVSGRPLVKTKEKNYYFRLSAYQARMEKLLEENPDFIKPQARRNEILGRLRDGLLDVPMSRTSFSWGVPMPDHDEHVIYVWIEALMNYITGLGLAESESEAQKGREKYWPATYHVVGKEILWFHTVIWPCILMALDMPLPRCVYAHSFWIREGQKMSKSLGNFIDLDAINHYLDAYGSDMWRYYMITQGPLGATDANFSSEHYHDIYHTDLVNTLGNCASRVTAMINKYFDGKAPSEIVDGQRLEIGDLDWPAITSQHVENATQSMANFDLPGSVGQGLALLRRIDAFINQTEPFKLAKDDSKRDELGAILYQCIEAIRIASLILWAALPDRIPQLWEALGQDIDPSDGDMLELATWGGLKPGTSITKIALFPRIESLVEA